MKRNWFIIGAILVLIVAYELLVLAPYNKKYAPPPAVETVSTTTAAKETGSPAMSAAPGSVPVSTEKKLGISAEEKASAEKVEINDSRYFSVYSDGTLGDVVFTKYFKRGAALKEPIRISENGLHWSSTDPRVNACLRSFKKNGLNFVGEAGGVKCSLSYTPNNLLLGAKLDIESATEIQGDILFENEDSVGDGPEFDHRYLTLKKKDEKVSRTKSKKLWEEDVKETGPFEFVSWGDKYFATTLLPKGRYNPNAFHREGYSEKRVHWGLSYPIRWAADNQKLSYELDVYFSLKDFQEVRSVRADLDNTIDFGFFGAIAKFMLWCLEGLHNWFGNYGVAIIILSLLIRLLLWPVNRKMFESGQKMKEIQPQMEAIKKKYEGKTEQMMQMNNEIRQLYSKAGVNPLGSCFPVLLQIPIFFALNTALSNSVDLYQAPFFGWIHDLSYKDPLYILPVIWTISLIFSVELNPQPASQPGMPDMKWVSRVMFVVFGFVSKDFPSGLNLYFLVSNLAGMWQQWLFKRKSQVAKQNILLGKER